MKKLVITTGDPSGIGPEIVEKTLRFHQLSKNIIYIIYGKIQNLKTKQISSIDSAKIPGILYERVFANKSCNEKNTKLQGKIVYDVLSQIVKDKHKIDAVVNAPICKENIRNIDKKFIGHTEFFAGANKDFAMSFFGPHFNLALLTTHLSIGKVEKKLSEKFVKNKISLIYKQTNTILKNPKFAMLAVNPHAGENGAFGTIDGSIALWLQDLAKKGIPIAGPFPADTFFTYHSQKYDMVISAYHDQALVPFKMLSKGKGVNVTLGLPFIRTSVDHGTAFDIAGKNLADHSSLNSALLFAERALGSPQKKTDNYNTLANYYDKYMEHVNYDSWVDFILEIYKKEYKKLPSKILELACGTANIATRIQERGLNVIASDISERMLTFASKKKFCPNLVTKSMLDELPQNTYDLILVLFDSLNYLLQAKHIQKLLQNVYNGLEKNGMFIFDVSTIKNSKENFDNFLDFYQDSNSFILQESFLKGDLQTNKFCIFTKNGYLFEKSTEKHIQRIYKIKFLIDLIKKTKFKLVGIFSKNVKVTNLEDLDYKSERVHFVLKKG